MNENEKKNSLDVLQRKWAKLFRVYNGALTDANGNFNKKLRNTLLTNNPFIQNTRVKKSSAQPSTVDKEKLTEALNNPSDNENLLKNQSLLMFFQNYIYGNLLRLNREVPQYKWYILPEYVEKKEMNKDYIREYAKAEKAMKKFDPQLQLKTVNMQVQQEGKCSYLVRKSYDAEKVNFFVLQKLNPEAIKITSFGSKQTFTVSFNMVLFLNPMYDISMYPLYIQNAWEEMNKKGIIHAEKKSNGLVFDSTKGVVQDSHSIEFTNGQYAYWVQLNQEDCWTFGQDLSNAVSVPESIGLFLDFKELGDYKWLMGNLMAKSVTSILTATVPLKKDAAPGTDATLISPDMITYYDSIFSNSVSNTVLSFFGPFTDFKLHSIDTEPDNMNIVFNRLRDLVATSGNAGLLSISDKPSIAVTKSAQLIAASKAQYLTSQFEQFLNCVINEQFGLEHSFKIVLWSDIFDTNQIKMAKDLLLQGREEFLPIVLSEFNYTLMDSKSTLDLIKVLGLHTETDKKSNDETNTTNKVNGRPPLDIENVENDSTADSINGGDNITENKEFYK